MQFIRKAAGWVAGRGKLAAASVLAIGIAVGGMAAADAAGNPSIPDRSVYHIDIAKGAVGADTIGNRSVQSYHLNKDLVNVLLAVPANGVDSSKVKDGSLTEADLSPELKTKVNQVGTGEQGPQGPQGPKGDTGKQGPKGDKGDAGDPATDVKGAVVVDKTFEPTAVEKVGGSFSSNATVVGTVTLPAGKLKIDADGFWTTLAAGPAGTRPQLALRAGSKDLGTIFPGEASPAKDREITGHSTKVVELDEATVVTVYAFGYNDDQSANGAGRLQVTASVVATRG